MKLTRRNFLATAAAVAPLAVAAQTPTAAPDAQYRACVIGHTGQGDYGHALHLIFAPRPDVEVVALADPDEAGRAKAAAQAGAARTYADYREMLEKEEPNLVVVAPRLTGRHREYLLAAAEVGAHGFMEKPLADNLADADAMVQAVEEANLKWAIAYNFRPLPIIEHALKLVMEDGLVGEILELRARGKEVHRAGGEDLLVLGVHVFDLMRVLAGDPRWCFSDITVDGRPARPGDVHEATEPLGPVVGDRIHAVYGFDNGVKGYFASTKSADGNGGRWGLDIYGSKGIVTLRLDTPAPAFHLADASWAPGDKEARWQPLPGAPDAPAQPDPEHRYKPVVDDLLAAIEEDRRPAVSIQDGRASLEMIQAVYESFIAGGPVPFPLERREHPLKSWK